MAQIQSFASNVTDLLLAQLRDLQHTHTESDISNSGHFYIWYVSDTQQCQLYLNTQMAIHKDEERKQDFSDGNGVRYQSS